VLQEVFLFHGTVRENILFGRSGASDEEMHKAAQVANAHDLRGMKPSSESAVSSSLVGSDSVSLLPEPC